jgi:WD40 repeat protein
MIRLSLTLFSAIIGTAYCSAGAPQSLRPDPSVIAAWKAAGATFGWMTVDALGRADFVPSGSQLADDADGSEAYPGGANAATFPAFRYDLPLFGSMARLPPPAVPFGLVVRSVPKDADLKEVARFKQLRVLRLEEAARREGSWRAGSLKELAALEALEALDCDAVSEQQNGELTNLKQLKSIHLKLSNATTQAIDDVAKLTQLETLSLDFTSPYTRADSDAALEELARVWRGQRLHRLILNLASTHLTEAGLKALAGLRQAELTLNLAPNRLGSASYKALARLDQLRSVGLSNADVTDADLKELAAIQRLEELFLAETKVTDAGMPELARLSHLQRLDLFRTGLTNAGVKALTALPALKSLGLGSTKTTAACLKDVATFKRLERLWLPDSVRDADLKQLAGMNLTSLLVPDNAQTDIGLTYYLAAIRPSPDLNLAFWHVSDVSMKDVGRQKQLRALDLSYTQVTDVGLAELVGLDKLRFLDVTGTEATEVGARSLTRKIPGLQVRGAVRSVARDRIGEAHPPLAALRKWHPADTVRMLTFAANGKTLLSLGTESSQLWDVRTGEALRSYDDFPPRTHGELPIFDPFAVSGDGRWVALGPVLVEVATGTTRTLKGTAVDELTNAALSFSPDGQMLALGSVFGNIHVWDIATGKELHRLRWQQMEHCALVFSRDGKLLAAGSSDRRIGLWEVASAQKLRVLGQAQPFEPVNRLLFSGDGIVLASCTPNGPCSLWEVASGKHLSELPEHEVAMDFSPRGRLLASWGVTDYVIHLRDVATRQERPLKGHSEEITAIAFSPDGKTLASASRDRTFRLWDVATGKQRFILRQQKEAVEAMTFSPDGKLLASFPGPEDQIQLWDPVTGKEIGR